MTSSGLKFLLLLKKNFLIQKRKVITTVFEIGVPTFFALILIFIRLRVDGSMKTEVKWQDCEKWDSLKYFPKELPKKLAFTPDNAAVNHLMDMVLKYDSADIKDVKGFKTEDEMVNFLMFANKTVNNTSEYIGGIVFTKDFTDEGKAFADNIEYKIRFSSSPRNAGRQKHVVNTFLDDTKWNTEFTFPLFQKVGPREINKTCGGDPGYAREGFLAVQHAINMAIIRLKGNGSVDDQLENLAVSLRRHPYPAFNDDNFILVIQQQFPLILMLSFVLVALNIVRDVVHEKERKLKESLKMMGINNWIHWLAWTVKYFLFLLITVTIMTIFLCIKTEKGAVIGGTSPTVVLVFLMLYALSTISFCFAVSVFFAKANSGAAAGGILFFVTYIPYFFLQPRYETLTWGQKVLTSLISNTCMAYGGQIIGMFEGTGDGVQWSNVMDGVSVDDNFTMFNVMIMLLIDTFLYGLVTWYVEAVFPGEFGVPQRWYFPFQKSYWCGTRQDDFVPESKLIAVGQKPEFFEPDPVGVNAGIRIRNLRKEFKNGDTKKVAVSGMTLDMYEGQITALLGHNGAGKTTTMSMLTGFIPPTGGTAYVNGYDIRKDIASVRSSLGLCPQHDVLFDTLTVEEHLVFFAKLKGCPPGEVPGVVNDMLQSLNLNNKRHDQSRTLSGGMKRKLSVGIALIGGSKVVILDEPSSGMDPDARRHIWSVLQKNRYGRTMVLTTHFMDEADLLGDRIAIMADGMVRCCGSSLFLKNKYGAGYHLVIVKNATCNVSHITSIVKNHVPEAKLENNVGAELSFILPHEQSHRFEALFTQIEDNSKELGIDSYGASVTTMEEVFLRVGESSNGVKDKRAASREHSGSSQDSVTRQTQAPVTTERTPLIMSDTANMMYGSGYQRSFSFAQEIIKNKGIALKLQQFYAIFVKRMLHTMRNKLVTFTQLAVPLFFTISALIVVKTFPGPQDSPALSLSTADLGANDVVYSLKPNISTKADMLRKFYGNLFQDEANTVPILVNNQSHYYDDPDIMKFLLAEGRGDIGRYNLNYLVGADIHPTKSVGTEKLNVTAFFNNQAYHTPAVTLVTVANALLQFFTNNSDLSIGVINHPLPRTDHDKFRDETTSGTTGFTVAFNVVFGMAFLASSFTLFLIKERATKAKHLQFTSGVSLFTYWPATFCWDMVNYLMPAGCLLLVLLAFDVDGYVVEDHLAHVALLFILYGMSMLPFMYLCSFLFTVPSTGFVWLTMFNILSGVATILAVGILGIPQLNLLDLSHALEWVFLVLLPNYCLGQGLEDYYSNYRFKAIYDEYCIRDGFKGFCEVIPNPCCRDVNNNCGPGGCLDYNPNPLGWESNGIGRMLVFLLIQCVVYFTILLLLESEIAHGILQKLTRKISKKEVNILAEDSSIVQEDDDVARERSRLANAALPDLIAQNKLVIMELSKYYGNNLAVNRISVGIGQAECFGLLGVNGAGKTTTFKMITGDETLSSGTAYLGGHDIVGNIAEVRGNLGYCPQFDALIDQMTGREMLYMFARLRGIKKHQIADVVDDLLDALLIREHADKLVQAYSGGNKRKLSTAIALVGNPSVIFLDEPTTGMDPLARRYLWDTLCNIRASGRTLVLTSHSMEECEALCTRLAIMVNGQFKCLGSTQHLKNKFGEGYTLLARVSPTQDGSVPDPRPLMNFIEQAFEGCLLKDLHQGSVHYHITDSKLKWAQIFGTMEKAKSKFNVEDYSVSQTTLEQVFINFARAQKPPREALTGCCRGFCFACTLCSGCCSGRRAFDDLEGSSTDNSNSVNV